jgi:trigger factor
MLGIEIKRMPGSEIEVVGEIPAGDFEKYRELAVKKLSQETRIDGFRPGSAPENILVGKIGEGAILEEAAEIALQKIYPQILGENKIIAIGHPEITVTKIARNNPFCFKLKTAVIPEIILPDYKSIASGIEKNKEDGSDEEKIKARERRMIDILKKISSSTKTEIPKILLEAEKKRGGGEDAEDRIKFNLILSEIAKKEGLGVTEEKLREETGKIMNYYKNSGIDERRARDYAYGILLNESVFQFLESC